MRCCLALPAVVVVVVRCVLFVFFFGKCVVARFVAVVCRSFVAGVVCCVGVIGCLLCCSRSLCVFGVVRCLLILFTVCWLPCVVEVDCCLLFDVGIGVLCLF